jgi:hypothetical protein
MNYNAATHFDFTELYNKMITLTFTNRFINDCDDVVESAIDEFILDHYHNFNDFMSIDEIVEIVIDLDLNLKLIVIKGNICRFIK